jgi:hypothetical protein
MSHSSRPGVRRFTLPLLLVLMTASAGAQISPWSSIPASTPQTLQLEQLLFVATQGNVVNVFSALTRTWTSMTAVYGAPTNTLLNEHLIVRDGPIFYGYSPRSAAFQGQFTLSPSPSLVGSASAQTWHSIVIDGNYVHAFFPFSGQWLTYVFPSPPTVTMAMNGRFCFLISAGGNLYAVSSFYGTLVPAPVAGATSAGSFGNVALASSPGMMHGFSASRNTWASLPVAAAPTITTGNAQPAFVALNDGAAISMFSGNTGTFTTLPAAPGASVNLERYQGIVVDGVNAYGYSALLGTTSTLTLTGPVTVIKQQMFALIDDGSNLIAYSAPKGAFCAPIANSGVTLLHKAQIATLTPSGTGVPVAVYSSFRNQWDPGPGVATGTAYLTAVSVIVEDTAVGGLHGWSDRDSAWLYLAAPLMDVAVAGSSPPNLAETFFARQGNTIYTFNPRTSAWRTATTSAPATLIRAHHAVVLAHDGLTAYGFNIWSDTWTAQPLSAPYSNGGGQVEAAWVTDGVRLYAYGGLGQLNTITEFPDFYRAPTLGSLFRLEVGGEPGAQVIIGVALAPGFVSLPIGTLLLDPSTMAIFAQAAIPPGGVFGLLLQIPLDPLLSGFTPHFQAAILGPTGPYLTNSVFPTIY